ncbi:MAG: XRE family transcriptional regulator [Caldilineaceae bacterium]|nr:XRE family transcriptional regulator [Caldilineaceae bacterium]
MMPSSPVHFDSVGGMLRFLRRRARLSQRELSIAVGFSESHVSRIENNERPIDRTTLLALFVPVLHIQNEPALIDRLLVLCERNRTVLKAPAQTGSLTAADSTTLAVSNRLPTQLTSFIGRREELDEICDLLRNGETRLITLTGAGGCGKTRLALRVAENFALEVVHGVWWVELAALTDPQLLLRTVATTFDLTESPDHPFLSALTEYLRPRPALLILDNCEHLVDGVARLADALLRACAQLQILATSREILAVPGETIFRVQPLSLPPALPGGQPAKEEVEAYDAISLFVARAQATRQTFLMTDQNAPAIAHICQRLDGIPLGIEMAAAWVNLLRPEEIAERLAQDFDLLMSGNRTVLPRHQTLIAAIEWSHNLLSEPEQVLLRRLSVFRGGWNLEAAEGVAGEMAPLAHNETLTLLQRLVNQSMVVVDRYTGSTTRFRLLETVRDHAYQKLMAAGEEQQVRSLHLAYFSRLTQKTGHDAPSQDQRNGLAALELEEENLRSALDWSHSQPIAEEELRLAAALGPFWQRRGYYVEGCRRLTAALARNPKATPVRAQALLWAGA